MATTRILLVEDDDPTRRRLHDALAADPDFEVDSVGNLADARAAIAKQPPHVLLTDLELPDGHGPSLPAEVHAEHPTVEILRAEERRAGKECVSTCKSRWSPSHYKKQKTRP